MNRSPVLSRFLIAIVLVGLFLVASDSLPARSERLLRPYQELSM